MKEFFTPRSKHTAIQALCVVMVTLFFWIATDSVKAGNASQDPFALTPEKMGIFTGLPDKFSGFFSGENQVLNGFFNYVQQNLGGAAGLQGPSTPPLYPPQPIPIPVTSDFIKITSTWTANCIKDVPPDELHPETMVRPGNQACPWSPTSVASACPRAPGIGCCTGSCGCIELCLNSGGGFTVTNNCSGTIGDVTIMSSSGFLCGPFNIAGGRSTTVCGQFGVFTGGTLTDAKAGGACLISNPSQCCPAGAQDLCSVI